ncbi:ferritin family protein [Myxococcota bacterium]|nr:ferritin family protein [Myxococcota bacterium]MBU1413844.1 ferritin family protein [Myxococcota bacterium]MBU1509920.1 ferritin family protein [Myxococcota bacterium]
MNQALLNILEIALTMEEKGYSFYNKVVNTTKNPLGRAMFGRLRDDELVHMERIKTIIAGIQGGSEWKINYDLLPSRGQSTAEMFRELARSHAQELTPDADDVEAINVGLDFEAKAVTFYEEHLKDAQDPLEQEFIRKMIVEEKDHHDTCLELKRFYADPAAFFVELEHPHMD